MSKIMRNTAAVGVIAVLAGAGGVAYMQTRPGGLASLQSLFSGSPPAPPAPAVAAPPAPATPAAGQPATQTPPAAQSEPAPLPASTVEGSASPADVATLEFQSSVAKYSLVRDSAAYVAPNLDAPQMYPLRAGTGLVSAEKSGDGKWLIALTVDGQAAYLPADDMGPYDPDKIPKAELPANVAGKADVIDTGHLTVDGQTVPLAGVTGKGGDFATQMKALLDSQASAVTCALQGQAYVCTLPNGLDIGRAAIYNGAADVAPDASADYKLQADAAKAGHRGIWK